jgi:hypothetical protein
LQPARFRSRKSDFTYDITAGNKRDKIPAACYSICEVD